MPFAFHGACIVSIHDVCPATLSEVRVMIEDLEREGVGAFSLLVVPQYHHGEKASESAEFCAWLHERVRKGDEAVLHGYYHQRLLGERSSEEEASRKTNVFEVLGEKRDKGDSKGEEPKRFAIRNVYRELVATVYTAGEGEFYDIEEGVARELLQQGLEEFGRMGLPPAGFIAPAWLMGSGAWSALRGMPFRYTTTIDSIWDLSEKRRYSARSLVYSVRNTWRRTASLMWNELLLMREVRGGLIRIGLHPPDWRYPEIRGHVLRCVRRAVAGRKSMTYGSWIVATAEGIDPRAGLSAGALSREEG